MVTCVLRPHALICFTPCNAANLPNQADFNIGAGFNVAISQEGWYKCIHVQA